MKVNLCVLLEESTFLKNYVSIVYNDKYEISFRGLQNWYPFDTKIGKIHTKLEDYFQVFSLTKLNIDILLFIFNSQITRT
jgi:hypothetical protein